MKYTREEVLQYVQEEEVAFIHLTFCDVFGRQKNISIVPSELSRAFEYGIAFDASAIAGFGDEAQSDLPSGSPWSVSSRRKRSENIPRRKSRYALKNALPMTTLP